METMLSDLESGIDVFVYDVFPSLEDCGYFCLREGAFADREVIASPLDVWRAEAAPANGSLNDLLTVFGYSCLETIWELAFITEDMEAPHAVPALLLLPASPHPRPFGHRSRAPARRGRGRLATRNSTGPGRACLTRRPWRRTSS